ncbi:MULTISPECIES: glycine--tRNA ligase subunit beta [unclassified Helicobacter]|uniref:glycine--tRNA ligase subunit beta n=1 Tax=unclassified Helicobacter TaxID=2593540 RepID=UPI001F3EFA2F|nr:MULTISPECIES: glycine--tRNA ligase subunit beta [unclassified Helicobacter]
MQLFVEILVEELPALPFLKEFKNFGEKWDKVLLDHKIKCNSQFFYTPRRIVICVDNFPKKTQDEVVEVFGPPVQIAFEGGDKNQKLAPAGEAFLRKNNLSQENLQTYNKNNKEVLYAKLVQDGIFTDSVIVKIVESFLESLSFGKHMRWGNVKESFIRPIRNIIIFLDGVFFKSCAYGLQSEPKTLVHRSFGYDYKEVTSFLQYQDLLEKNGVILSQERRREIILEQIRSIEAKNNVCIEIDSELLDEVVAITEYPRAILGSFDEKFLVLPKEVIITSMKENQRYFAVYKDKTLQELSNHFVMVSNSVTKNEEIVVLGNQKVLRARLEDAIFFYENDLRNGLQTDGLANIVFIDGAGSIWDKIKREIEIAKFLVEKIKDKELNWDLIQQAITFSKADLLSEMVYEFPNLQGLMGSYYAKAMNLGDQIALAIKEQYLPTGEKSALPSSLFSSIVALANKFDNIFTLFSVGKIPTGSRDPFALRRSASGILRIILAQKIDFDLQKDLRSLSQRVGYQNICEEKIPSFFIERMEGILGVNPSLIKSVLATKEANICDIFAKVEALNTYLSQDKETFVATFKRVANILKDMPEVSNIDPKLFEYEAEKKLFSLYEKISKSKYDNYVEQMKNLCSFKPLLDDFFNEVMVNVENQTIRQNRVTLITRIYNEFLKIADIKEISF